jgi:hypothetical protein
MNAAGRGKVVVKDQSSSGGMMRNHDEEPNNPCWNEKSRVWRRMEGYQLPWCPCSPDFWQKKQIVVLISASNQVLIVVFLISASNKVLYHRLHDVRDEASTPGLMSFDPVSVNVVARNFYPLRRCVAPCLGAVAMLYPDKQEKCNWINEGITIVKHELEDQLEWWDRRNASGEETKQIMWFTRVKHCGGLWCQGCCLL